MGFLSRLTGYLQGVFKHLNPAPPIGGLEISDSALRYVLFENNVPQVAALRLPPGILENGRVKDRANFVAALKNVRGQIPVPSKKRVHVIVSFPPALVYAQAFSLPLVSETNLEEAARLNLQMISPTDPKNTYSDWQRIEAPNESENIELLGALIENKAADELIAALREAGSLAGAACRRARRGIRSSDAGDHRQPLKRRHRLRDRAGRQSVFQLLRLLAHHRRFGARARRRFVQKIGGAESPTT